MQNTLHPLVSLLKLSGLKLLTNEANYSLFDRLKEALSKDGQSVVCYADEEVPLSDSISSNQDLVQHEGEFLRGVIKSWSVGVLTPFIEALNTYTVDGVDIVADMDGYLFDANIYFREDDAIDVYLDDMTFEHLVANIDEDYIDDAKKLCKDWQHTLEATTNGADLAELIAAL